MKECFNEDYLVKSQDYGSVMDEIIIPELKKRARTQTVSGKDKFPLHCVMFSAENARGTVVIVHGFTENVYKYSEMIWSFLMNRFSVIAYDQRGHGLSGRAENLPHPSATHVDHFEDYVEDLKIICQEILPGFPKPWNIFAHSMGGAVTALYLESCTDTFSAAVLCAPMIAPNISGVPVWLASGMCRTACHSGRGKRIPFFMKPYSGPEDFKTSCATDPERFAWYDAVKASRKEYWNSVPTYQWILESIHVTGKILSPGKPESITCPVLLSTADHDFSVMPDPQKRFIERVRNGRHLFVKDSRHEIFRSVNDVFFPWWHEVLTFLEEVAE